MRRGIGVTLGVRAKLLETLVRPLLAKAKCAGAQLKLLGVINRVSGDARPTPVGPGQTCSQQPTVTILGEVPMLSLSHSV